MTGPCRGLDVALTSVGASSRIDLAPRKEVVNNDVTVDLGQIHSSISMKPEIRVSMKGDSACLST